MRAHVSRIHTNSRDGKCTHAAVYSVPSVLHARVLPSCLQFLFVLERLGESDGRRLLQHQGGGDGLSHSQVQRAWHQHPARATVTTGAAAAALVVVATAAGVSRKGWRGGQQPRRHSDVCSGQISDVPRYSVAMPSAAYSQAKMWERLPLSLAQVWGHASFTHHHV